MAAKIGRRTMVRGLGAGAGLACLSGALPTALTLGERADPGALALRAENGSAASALRQKGDPAGDWERLGPDAAVGRLFAPASGALFAASALTLYRSDDAGAAWRQIGLPPAGNTSRREILVHPLDQRIIFARGVEGLYRSDDEGTSWSVVLPGPRFPIRIAASPADPALLYVALSSSAGSDFWFMRSRDGGVSWETLDEAHNSLCFWNAPILQPHPGDPARLLRTAGCYAGRNLGDDLKESRDAGATFAALIAPQLAFPAYVVGGTGAAPARWYLAANRDSRSGGSSLFATADDGAAWVEVLQFRGGGTMEQGKPNVRMGGLAYDPASPDRVVVALNRALGPDVTTTHLGAGLTVSSDAGATWSDFGRQDLPIVHDLALGIDARWLFAATDDGVWRRPS